MEEERIAINGMKFKAERLIPNHAGQYTCKCEECIFDKDWVDFGDETPCRKVACIRNKWHDGNRNVWAVDGSLDDYTAGGITTNACGRRKKIAMRSVSSAARRKSMIKLGWIFVTK